MEKQSRYMKKKNFKFVKVDNSNWYKYNTNPEPSEFWFGQCDKNHPFDIDRYIKDENLEIIYIGGDADKDIYINAPTEGDYDPTSFSIDLPEDFYKHPENQLSGDITLKVKEIEDVNGLYQVFWATCICLRSRGVSLEHLKNLVYNSYKYTKGHGAISQFIHIDKDNNIYLKNRANWHHGIEVLGNIALDTTTKALFILFLRHPEGISKSQLPNYIKEMSEIYKHITKSDQLSETSIKAIKNMMTGKQSTFGPAKKRIKDAFLKYLEDDLARECYIRTRPHTKKFFIQLRRTNIVVD